MTERIESLSHPIDARARHAARVLRTSARSRPLPNVPGFADHRRMRPVLVLACLLVLVCGLVVVGSRGGSDDAVVSDLQEERWLVGDSPEPLEVVAVSDDTNSVLFADDQPKMAVFGTDQAPLGPQLVISVPLVEPQDNPPLETPWATNFVEREINGRRVVFADKLDGAEEEATDIRLTFVEAGDSVVFMSSRGLTDTELGRVASDVVVGADGAPEISPDVVPAELGLLGVGQVNEVAPIWVASIGGYGGETASGVTYQVVGSPAMVRLAVGETAPADTTVSSLSLGEFVETDVDGHRAWFFEATGESTLVWQRDGLTFYLSQSNADEDLLQQLADGVRRASASEWQELVAAVPEDFQNAPTGTELAAEVGPGPDDAPAETEPPANTASPRKEASVVDHIIETARNAPSLSSIELTASLPDGFAYQFDVSVLDDGVRIVPGVADLVLGSATYDRPIAEPFAFRSTGGGDSSNGVSVLTLVTEEIEAAILRVTRSNGERYILELQTVDAHPNVGFAGVVMPRGEFVSADVVSVDGRILAKWEMG